MINLYNYKIKVYLQENLVIYLLQIKQSLLESLI